MGCNRVFNRVLSGGRVNLPGYTGFFLSLFFLKLGPVSAPGRSGPGLTRRAGPGFKIIIDVIYKLGINYFNFTNQIYNSSSSSRNHELNLK
jgi:hypothetical protein